MDVYWDMVRKTLTSLDHNRVFLQGLGTFYIKPWSIEKKLKVNEAKVNSYMENPSSHSLHMMNEIFKENIKLEAVRDREVAENKIKAIKRYERHNQDLEGEGQDS